MHILRLICCAAAIVLGAFPTRGATIIVVDQFGDGTIDNLIIAGFPSIDPGPGGQTGVLTYSLLFDGVQGDLILTDPNFSDLPLQVIRFNGNGTVIFYAGNDPTSLAFTLQPPASLYDNVAIVSDIGPETASMAFYTPDAGEPGFDASGPTFEFINSGAPEPGVVVLFSSGVAMLALLGRRRKPVRQ